MQVSNTMESNLKQERRLAHALIDMLPAEKLNAVRSLLEVMVEPIARPWPKLPSKKSSPRKCLHHWNEAARPSLEARVCRTKRFFASLA